jgi:molybdate transport system substrate-binding protein
MSVMIPPLMVLSSMAPREVLAAAIAAHPQPAARRVRAQAAGGVDVARRIAAGEAVDIVVLANDAIDKLAESAHVSADTRVDLMDSEIAAAVTAGGARPSLDDEEAVRTAVVSAASVSYSTGPSGRYLEKLFDRWGILQSVRDRIVVPPPGVPVASLVASGEVRLGFQQRSELINVAGIDIVGSLPAEIQYVTTFTGVLTSHCSNIDAARALLAYLGSPGLDALKRRYGMAPVRSRDT